MIKCIIVILQKTNINQLTGLLCIKYTNTGTCLIYSEYDIYFKKMYFQNTLYSQVINIHGTTFLYLTE